MERNTVTLKRDWLENALGIDKLGDLLLAPPATRVQLIGVSLNGMTPLMDDQVPGFTPDTGFSDSEQVYPALWMDPPQTLRLLVPLNVADLEAERPSKDRSLVRIYTLPAR